MKLKWWDGIVAEKSEAAILLKEKRPVRRLHIRNYNGILKRTFKDESNL